MVELTYHNAHELFDYDSSTGKLFWKVVLPRQHYATDRGWSIVNTRYAGKEACNVNKSTLYLQVVFDKRLYQVHRVIWLMHCGQWPSSQIDHLNRDRQDNRISNLRAVTHAENMLNRSDNTSGHPNIHFRSNRPTRPWLVMIKTNGVALPQKTFAELGDAIAHRDALRAQHQLPPV